MIVASHLLDEYTAATHTNTATETPADASKHDPLSFSSAVGLTGAVVTAITSFSVVGLIHLSRTRSGSGINPRKIIILLVVLPLVGAVFYAFARRQWLRFVRQQALQGASEFINGSQRFDSLVSSSVLFIQEVELVSRGYRMYVPKTDHNDTVVTGHSSNAFLLCIEARHYLRSAE